MGLDKLPTPRRRTPLSSKTAQSVGDGDAASIPTGDNDAATAVAAAAAAEGLEDGKEREREVRERKGGASDDKMREVSLVSTCNMHIIFVSMVLLRCQSFSYANACGMKFC